MCSKHTKFPCKHPKEAPRPRNGSQQESAPHRARSRLGNPGSIFAEAQSVPGAHGLLHPGLVVDLWFYIVKKGAPLGVFLREDQKEMVHLCVVLLF